MVEEVEILKTVVYDPDTCMEDMESADYGQLLDSSNGVDDRCEPSTSAIWTSSCSQTKPTESTEPARDLNMENSNDLPSNTRPTQSIADMVKETVNAFIRESYLPGFEFNEQYQLYYSAETGYYYDQNTSLYYYPPTRCYYYYDEATASYVYHSRVASEQKWKRRAAKRHAIRVFGESYTLGMPQDEVEIFDCIHEIIDEIIDNEIDPVVQLDSDDDDDVVVLDSESDDEIQQMMQIERMEHAPCIRLVDCVHAHLSVITITGGRLGSSPNCDIQLPSSDANLPDECVRVHYEEAVRAYQMSTAQHELPIFINGTQLEVNDERIVEHGDIWTIGDQVFVAHLHYVYGNIVVISGDNTCSGCEPGLFSAAYAQYAQQQTAENVSAQKSVKKRSSEALRRRNLRLMKAQYGLLGDDLDKSLSLNSASMRSKRNQRSTCASSSSSSSGGVQNDGSIYAKCSAKPVSAAGLDSVVLQSGVTQAKQQPFEQKALDVTNKGYKLLQGMGWKEGSGLGKTQSGIKEPIMSEMRSGRAGLGCSEVQERANPSKAIKSMRAVKRPQPPAADKIRILQITQQRFNQEPVVCIDDDEFDV